MTEDHYVQLKSLAGTPAFYTHLTGMVNEYRINHYSNFYAAGKKVEEEVKFAAATHALRKAVNKIELDDIDERALRFLVDEASERNPPTTLKEAGTVVLAGIKIVSGYNDYRYVFDQDTAVDKTTAVALSGLQLVVIGSVLKSLFFKSK